MALPAPVQLIGSAITPVSLQQPAATTPAAASSSGSGLGYLGSAIAGAFTGTGSSTPAPSSPSSGASGVGTAIGAAKAGSSVTGNSTLGSAASLAGDALSVYNGVKQGGALGYTGAAISGVKGANTVDSLATGSGFLSTGASSLLGGAGDVFGIINGVKQGGVAGYGGAALDAANLYNSASAIGAALSGETASGAAVAADAAAGSVAAGGDAAGAVAAGGMGAAAGLGVFGAAAMAMDAIGGAIGDWEADIGKPTETQAQFDSLTPTGRAEASNQNSMQNNPLSLGQITGTNQAAQASAVAAELAKDPTGGYIPDPSSGRGSIDTPLTQQQYNALSPSQQAAYTKAMTTVIPATSLYNPTGGGSSNKPTTITIGGGF